MRESEGERVLWEGRDRHSSAGRHSLSLSGQEQQQQQHRCLPPHPSHYRPSASHFGLEASCCHTVYEQGGVYETERGVSARARVCGANKTQQLAALKSHHHLITTQRGSAHHRSWIAVEKGGLAGFGGRHGGDARLYTEAGRADVACGGRRATL